MKNYLPFPPYPSPWLAFHFGPLLGWRRQGQKGSFLTRTVLAWCHCPLGIVEVWGWSFSPGIITHLQSTIYNHLQAVYLLVYLMTHMPQFSGFQGSIQRLGSSHPWRQSYWTASLKMIQSSSLTWGPHLVHKKHMCIFHRSMCCSQSACVHLLLGSNLSQLT